MRRLLVPILLVTTVTLCGCVAVSLDGTPHHGHGPPPHAPAHGYRQHHQGADLAFDSKLGVYLVVGYSDHFYSDGHFLRFHGDSWQVSSSLRGPWGAYSPASLPPGPRSTHPSNAKRPKHKAHPHAKRHW